MSDSPVAAPGHPSAPVLRVVRGTPTEAELAALVAVLAARGSDGAGTEPTDGPRVRGWRARSNGLRRPLLTGPGAWRAAPWLHRG